MPRGDPESHGEGQFRCNCFYLSHHVKASKALYLPYPPPQPAIELVDSWD